MRGLSYSRPGYLCQTQEAEKNSLIRRRSLFAARAPRREGVGLGRSLENLRLEVALGKPRAEPQAHEGARRVARRRGVVAVLLTRLLGATTHGLTAAKGGVAGAPIASVLTVAKKLRVRHDRSVGMSTPHVLHVDIIIGHTHHQAGALAKALREFGPAIPRSDCFHGVAPSVTPLRQRRPRAA